MDVTEPDDPLRDVLDYRRVSALTGIEAVTLRQMFHRGQMPEPIGQRSRGPLWSRASIESWMTTRQ